MTEEILIDLKIPGAEDKINELTHAITILVAETKDLEEVNKTLAKDGKVLSTQYAENAKQIELNKQKIQENTASRKGLVQAMNAEEGSIKSLRVANADLIKQRDQINTKTVDGQRAIQNINRQLDANNKVIRENSSQLEKQKINIGNYASALDNVVPGLGRFATGISNLVSPITAVSVGLGALVGLYAKSTIGTKDLEFASNQLSATINLLGNNFARLFSSSEDGEGFFSKLSAGLLAQVDLGATVLGRLSALNQEKLEDLNRDAKQALTDQQNLLEDNADILEKVADSQTIYNDKLYLSNTAIDNIRNGAEKVRLVREQELSVLEQQLAIDSANEELQDAILDKKLQIAQEARREEKLVNNIQKLQSNLADAEGKRLEAISKIAEKEESIIKHKEAQIDLQSEIDSGIAISEALAANEEEISLGLINMTLNTDKLSESIAKKNKATEDGIKTSKAANKSTGDTIQSAIALSAAVLGLAESESKAGRVLAITTIATNAAIGVSNAVKAGSGLIWPANLGAILSGITAVLVGITQAKSFLGNKAAGGGNFVTKGPTMLLVGDNPGGVEHISVTPISGKGTTRVVEGSGLTKVAMAGGGNLTAIGSNETRIAASSAQGQFDPKQVASLMDMVKIVLVRESYEAAQMQHNQTVNMAKVVG